MAATRREFLEAGASAALAATLADTSAWAKARRPNFVVVIVDTLRADYVGSENGKASTPHLDSLARDGLSFPFAYSHAPMTLPAHAARDRRSRCRSRSRDAR